MTEPQADKPRSTGEDIIGLILRIGACFLWPGMILALIISLPFLLISMHVDEARKARKVNDQEKYKAAKRSLNKTVVVTLLIAAGFTFLIIQVRNGHLPAGFTDLIYLPILLLGVAVAFFGGIYLLALIYLAIKVIAQKPGQDPQETPAENKGRPLQSLKTKRAEQKNQSPASILKEAVVVIAAIAAVGLINLYLATGNPSQPVKPKTQQDYDFPDPAGQPKKWPSDNQPADEKPQTQEPEWPSDNQPAEEQPQTQEPEWPSNNQPPDEAPKTQEPQWPSNNQPPGVNPPQ